jgi:hypothetical protein
MSQVAAKLAAGLSKQGCRVDVIAGGPFDPRLGFDPSLLPYADRNTKKVRYLQPSRLTQIKAQLRNRISGEVDPMHLLEQQMFKAIEGALNNNYAAVVTLSPFHTVNPIMVRLKKCHPDVRWIAQFSDPWGKNPLESSRKHETWNLRQEAETVLVADHLVFTSAPSRDLMLGDSDASVFAKTSVIDHCWDPDLYPLGQLVPNERVIIRHVGTLFGERTPEQLFQAALLLLRRRPELVGKFAFHLIGSMPKAIVETKAALALPPGTVLYDPAVSYLRSLSLMAAADALVLLEPDVKFNYFVPSKLIDYVGADRPILALTPPGASRQVIERLQLHYCLPGDVAGIATALGNIVDKSSSAEQFKASRDARQKLRNDIVATIYLELIDSFS